jgi:tetratricopeptide (TPR) repeat protein
MAALRNLLAKVSAPLGLRSRDGRRGTSLTASPTTSQSEEAVEDMRLARSYLKDWEDKATDDVLSFAAKHLQSARAKDSNAKLTVEVKIDGKTDLLTYSIDDLAGTTLYYQAQMYHRPNDRESLRQARDTLKTAIEYSPYAIDIRARLADVFLDLHDKKSALAVAKEAVASFPRDLDARKLLDRIEAAPSTRRPFPLSGQSIVLVAALAAFLYAIVSLFRLDFSTAVGSFVVAWFLSWILGRMESREMLSKAIQHRLDEEQRKLRQ